MLAALDKEHGYGRHYAYPMLVDLVQPWKVPLTLLEGNGNYGSSGYDPPADAECTECRLSAAGLMAVAAERGEGPPVPLGLINGTTYRGGVRPPYDPGRIAAALLLGPKASSAQRVEAAGPPSFPTGGEVTGDLATLAAGRKAKLRLTARIAATPFTGIPTPPGPDEAAMRIMERFRGRPESPCRSPGSTERVGTLICCRLQPGSDPEQVANSLREIWGSRHRLRRPAPLASLLRNWIIHHGQEASEAAANLLEGVTGQRR